MPQPSRAWWIVLALLIAGRSLAAADIKNILFVVADDLRANVLACYGNRVCQTPHIAKLASHGLVFQHAYCQGMMCAPSRLSFMHSRYTGKRGVNLGEYLQTQGLYTARVGKIYHMRVPGDIIAGTNGGDIASSWTERFNAPGREAHTAGEYACLNLNVFTRSQENRQSTRMPHRAFVSVVCDGNGTDQPDFKAATKAIEILRERKDKPFLLAVGFVRPHYPMVAPREYFDRHPHQPIVLPPTQQDDTEDIPKVGWGKSTNESNGLGRYPENQKRMWAAYYAAVSFMDAQVGRLLKTLDELGLRESTLVVFTSDHGYHLGDHGFWQKSNLHEQVIRVPLIISGPDMQQGKTSAIAELVDLYPTMCDVLGFETPPDVQGQSLLPVLRNKEAHVRDAALSLHQGGYSLRSRDWHYIRYKSGEEELYDMRIDPQQFDNLASVSDPPAELDGMRDALHRKLAMFALPATKLSVPPIEYSAAP